LVVKASTITFKQTIIRRHRHLLFVLLCTAGFNLAGCDEQAAPTFNTRALEVPKGITYPPPSATVQETEPFVKTILNFDHPNIKPHLLLANDPTVLFVELSNQNTTPAVIINTQTGLSAMDALNKNDLDVVLGSGFVTTLHSLQPVGLLRVNGETHSPPQLHGYTRVLGVNDKGIGVVNINAYQRDLFHSALQVGPGIVEEGRLDISVRELQRPKYFRSFVAICEGRWLGGVSLTPMHLHTLGEQLLDYFADRRWRCKDVVNLAGDREALLAIKLDNGRIAFHGDPETHKVSLVGFKSQTSND